MSEVADLERIGHLTWPALDEETIDGWLVRAANGVTRRSNSINPGDVQPADIGATFERCRSWLAARGLPPITRLTPLAPGGIEDALLARGLTRVPGALVMSRSIGRPVADPRVEISGQRADEWSDVLAEQDDRGGEARDTVEALLDSHNPPVGFAIARVDRVPAAVGMGVVKEETVGVFNMRTDEAHRRQGLAAAVLESLLAFGRDAGAATAFIQVAPANEAAIALYTSAGFETAYEYWYLEPDQAVS